MLANLFESSKLNAENQRKSYRWYQNEIRSLGITQNYGRRLLQSERLVTNVLPGSMYLFLYDPKHKATLPYYDVLPLVLPFRPMPDGFIGINLHYLPYMMRYNLLGELSKLADKKTTETNRINLSWRLLESSSKYLAATSCVKRYLTSNVKSKFLRIEYPNWTMAAMLPIEGFQKSNKDRVWRDTRKKITNGI